MQTYLGIKLINAAPMDRQAYNDLRNWTVPADENPTDPGYLVEYHDGGQANTPHFAGYVSWSPEDVFNRAYRSVEGLTFGMALEALKIGKKVARKHWNTQHRWIEYGQLSEFNPLEYIILSQNGDRVTWVGTQKDLLADDWEIVE